VVFQPSYGLPPYGVSYPYGQFDFDFQQSNRAFVCSGNILPFRFVTLDDAGTVRQSVADEWPIAVAQQNTQSAGTVYAGTAGYPIETFGSGYDCWLMAGATVRAGRYLMPDDEGRGIECLLSSFIAAQSYQDGAVGQLIRVRVLRIAPLSPQCYSDWSFEFDEDYGNDCDGPQT